MGGPLGERHLIPQGLGEPAPTSAPKEWQHPREGVAFRFWNTKPEPLRSFTSSTVVPFRLEN